MRKALLVALLLVANAAAWGQSISGNGGGISGNTGGGGGSVTVPTTTLTKTTAPNTFSQVTAIDAIPIGSTTPSTVAATSLASSLGLVDTSTPAANVYGINSTGGLKIGGTTGAIGTNGSMLDQENTYTFPLGSGAIRQRYLNDTILVQVGTSHVINEPLLIGQQFALPSNGVAPTITATLSGGTVGSLAISTVGSNLAAGTYTLTFYGGGGSGAAGTVTVDGTGTAVSTNLTAAGTGYTSTPGVSPVLGTLASEVNGFHPFVNTPLGVTLSQYESYEASTLFNGPIGVVDSALLLQNYGPTGSNSAGAFGVNIGLTNQNPTTGSLFEWTAINIIAPALNSHSVATTGASGDGTTATITFSGTQIVPVGALVTVASVIPSGYNAVGAVVTASSAGSVSYANATTGAQTVAGALTISGSPPTHDFGVRISDPNGDISTAGRVFIGSPAAANTTAGRMLTIQTPDQANGTFGVNIIDSTLASIFSVRATGNVALSGTLTAPGLGTGTQVSCLGLTSANLVVPVTGACGTSGGGVTSVSNSDGTITVATGTTTPVVSLNLTNSNAWTNVQTITGPDNAATNAFKVSSLSGTLGLAVNDQGITTVGTTLIVGQSGTQTGKISLTNATASSSSVSLIPPIGPLLTAVNVTVPDTTGTIVLTTTNQTLSGNSTFSGTTNMSGTFQIGGVGVLPNLSGTSSSIGGGALLAGACASTTVAITGLTTSMALAASPATYPGDGDYWFAYASSAGTATVKVCAAVADTPAASTYTIRVLQ